MTKIIPETKNQKELFATLLNAAPTLLAVIAVLPLMLSVIYDWAFLTTLGMPFSDVPSTISDHARSALNYLPFILVLCFALFLFVRFGATRDEREQHPKTNDSFKSEDEVSGAANKNLDACVSATPSRRPKYHYWLMRLIAIGMPIYCVLSPSFLSYFVMGREHGWSGVLGFFHIIRHGKASE